jgi:hypothetical protein
VRGRDVWYVSPFRPNERTPSFKVDATKSPQVWYDFGMMRGGTIIDLVAAMERTEDISRVLSVIASVAGDVSLAAGMVPPSSHIR